jgi:hypothetical protein
LPAPVLSPQQYACALHLWDPLAACLGRTECHHAPNQWTTSQSGIFIFSRSQSSAQHMTLACIRSGLHHLGLRLAIRVFFPADPIWPSICSPFSGYAGSQVADFALMIVSHGRVHLGPIVLFHSNLAFCLHAYLIKFSITPNVTTQRHHMHMFKLSGQV